MSKTKKTDKTKKTNEMPDFYQVKITSKIDPTWVYFGIQDKYSDESEAEWEKGNLVVSDAITGKWGTIPYDLDLFVFEKMPLEWGEYDKETRMPISTEYDRHILEAYKKAKKKSDSVKGITAGKMFSVGVADGQAVYVITKVNKKSVHIEWRSFGGGDNYVDRTLGYGGSFPKHCIEPHVGWEEALDKIRDKAKKQREVA